MLSLRLLGGASIEEEGGAVSGPATHRHRLALLALLASAHPRGVAREKLVALLWPEMGPTPARNLLNQAVYVLRKALGEAAIRTAADKLHLDPAAVPCDVVAFEAAVAGGAFEAAVDLYAGPFLDGLFLPGAHEFDRWLEGERDRLAASYGKALEALAVAAEAERDPARAAEWWGARAAHDPYDSRVALRLMEALEAAGNRAGALQHAAAHQRLLQEEFGTGPAPEVTALAERLRAGPGSGAPATSRQAEETGEGEAEPPPLRIGRVKASALGSPRPAPPAFPPTADAATVRVGHRKGWVAAAALVAVLFLAGAVWAAWPRTGPARSVAVLPFVNLSQDPDDDYFSDGLTEEIIARLSAVPELKVISRTSAMHYKGTEKPLPQIADELDVAHVLEGSVRQSGGRLRVTAQLIDARTDRHLWAQSYDRELQDVFRVQEEIALEVVRALEVELGERERRLLAREGTRDPGAYELYQRGRYFWGKRTREGHERAFEYYRRAIEHDSSYADAYSGLADAYLTAYQFNLTDLPEEEVYSRIKWAAERALALDDQSASAHASFAIVLWWQKNWPGAERELRRAIELNPGYVSARNWYSVLLSGTGRLEGALRESRLAYELDPFVPVISDNYGWHCYIARNHDCAVEQYQKAIEIDPAFAQAYQRLGLAYAQQRLPEEALRAFRRAAELNSAFLPDLAYGLAQSGERQEALETLERAKEEPFEPFYVGRAYVALWERDSAFAWFERSSWRFPHRANRYDPALDPLRADPRFARLSARVEREMGLE